MRKHSRSISRTDRRAFARLRLRDAADGFCGINHAVRMAELAGLTPKQIERELGFDPNSPQNERTDRSKSERESNPNPPTRSSDHYSSQDRLPEF